MTARILIVDDDPAQLRLLARLISMRRRDLTVLTASDGLEAIEVLESGQVEVVLTDLQMPEMNGFELLAWLATHQAHVKAYAMTAYPDAEAGGRLAKLRSIRCFTKPLDVAAFLESVSETLAAGARGHVQNIGLPSFLQLLSMERETCTLQIEARDRSGHLYILAGELIDAVSGDVRGTAAAVDILTWPSPAITILNAVDSHERTIDEPMNFLIMEALRLEDEHNADAASNAVDAAAAPSAPIRAGLPSFVRAAAVVPLQTGATRASHGDWTELEAWPQAAAQLFEGAVEEVVLTGPRYWLVAQPLVDLGRTLAIVAFDANAGNLVRARAVLKDIAATYERASDAYALAGAIETQRP